MARVDREHAAAGLERQRLCGGHRTGDHGGGGGRWGDRVAGYLGGRRVLAADDEGGGAVVLGGRAEGTALRQPLGLRGRQEEVRAQPRLVAESMNSPSASSSCTVDVVQQSQQMQALAISKASISCIASDLRSLKKLKSEWKCPREEEISLNQVRGIMMNGRRTSAEVTSSEVALYKPQETVITSKGGVIRDHQEELIRCQGLSIR